MRAGSWWRGRGLIATRPRSVATCSCQDLAQTTHHYAITKKRPKPALEQACQRMQGVKAHADQPPVLPVEHPRHRPDFLQHADHAIAAQAVPELGEATEPLLTPD